MNSSFPWSYLLEYWEVWYLLGISSYERYFQEMTVVGEKPTIAPDIEKLNTDV